MQTSCSCFVFFFNDTATTEIYTPSLHDALPISLVGQAVTLLPEIYELEALSQALKGSDTFGLVKQIGRAHV